MDDTAVLTAVDFLPTVCKLAGVEMPGIQPDGEDVSGMLLGQPRPRNKAIFWEWRGGVAGDPDYCPPRLAVRDGRWRLFCDFDGGNVQLYNIPADPEERNNLAEGNAEVVDRLTASLLAWKKTLPQGPVQEGPRSKARKR